MTTDIDPWAAVPSDEALDRLPPMDLDAEACVLGGMMLSPHALNEVFDIVSGPDFYRPAHEIVFDAIATLSGKGEPVDPITVTNHLREQGNLLRAGWSRSGVQPRPGVPTAANATYYAEIVREKAILRGLVRALHGDRPARLRGRRRQ